MNNSPAASFPVEELARAIAAQIAAAGGPQPTVTVTRSPAAAAAPAVESTDIKGNVTIAIKYDGVTYSLTFKTPSADFKAWYFDLKYQKGEDTPVDLAMFEFVDASNWAVTVKTPGTINLPFGDATLFVSATVSSGTVPTPKPTPLH